MSSAGVDPETTSSFIDRIYEAAFVPEMWPEVLRTTVDVTGSAVGAVFLFSDNAPPLGKATDEVRELLGWFLGGDHWRFSNSVQRMYDLKPASFVRVNDFLTAEQIEQDPVRSEMRARGLGAHLCTGIPMPTGEVVTFVLTRWTKDGEYDEQAIARMNGLRPHLARAGLMAARLRLERAQATASVLSAMDLPAAVLSSSGRVIAANNLFETASWLFLPVAYGGLAIADAWANQLFQEAVMAARQVGEPLVRSIPVAAREGHSALVLHVLPLRRAAHDIFSGADILVAATAMSASALVPAPMLLTGLFDLTPGEAAFATALAAGRTIREAATKNGLTEKSGRTYMERIFRKTGTHQQSHLVALLKSAGPLSAK